MVSLGLVRTYDDAQESLTHLGGKGSFRRSPGRNLGSPLGSVDLNHDILQVASTFKNETLQKFCLVTLVPLSFAYKLIDSLALIDVYSGNFLKYQLCEILKL